ncbi:unnamed protein product [Adineta ricciae]|nr:unnamed protein product [Adineta ricciae]
MHSLPVHFFSSCSLLLLLACASNAAPLTLRPNHVQTAATKIGNTQFISVTVPINGFEIQISTHDAAAPTSVVSVPMAETLSSQVRVSTVTIDEPEAVPDDNGAWFAQVNPQLHSKLRLPTTTSSNRQVDSSVNTQLEAHRSSQTHSSPNFRVHSPNRFTVNEAIPHVFVSSPAPQVQSKPSNSNGCETQVGSNGEKTISMANGNVNIVGQSLSCS